MNPESTDTAVPFDPTDPALHLEYLYGPQWRAVVRIVERAAQLTAEERERLNTEAGKQLQTGACALTVVSQAVTAAVLGDLVGRGRFTQDVYDALLRPWADTIS